MFNFINKIYLIQQHTELDTYFELWHDDRFVKRIELHPASVAFIDGYLTAHEMRLTSERDS